MKDVLLWLAVFFLAAGVIKLILTAVQRSREKSGHE